MIQEIVKLRDALEEKRSDIAEILTAIIAGDKWSIKDIEHRRIQADLPDGTQLEYDTLTTEISYLLPNDGDNWQIAKNHQYVD